MMERTIPNKKHSTEAVFSFSMITKGKSKINYLTNAICFYDNKRMRNTMGNETTVWKILTFCFYMFIFPYSSFQPL